MKKQKGSVVAVMPAAGRGKRLRSKYPKPFVLIKSIPLFVRTLNTLMSAYPFDRVIVPAEETCLSRMKKIAKRYHLNRVEFVRGGLTRAESVQNGLELLGLDEQIVLIHDMARPFVSPKQIRQLIQKARHEGASVLALKVTSTIKEINPTSGLIRKTLDRDRIYLAQTPQVFRSDLLRSAFRRRKNRLAVFTDEASMVESLKYPVSIVEGLSTNIKITTPEDLKLAEAMLQGELV